MIRLTFLCIFFTCGLNAQIFQTVSSNEATLIKKGETKNYCSNCGMNLTKFYKTNHIHNDKQYCSLHCLYESSHGNIEDDLKVVDVKSLKFIDVENAYYVIGSDVQGTMTTNSKYAFKNKQDALDFIEKHKGELVSFDLAYSIAKGDFKKDMKMIQKKRDKKVYKMGKKLYLKKCPEVNVNSFEKIDELKTHLSHVCKSKKDKTLQMISVYLWDIVKQNKEIKIIQKMHVPKDAKCPICGMFAYKYPQWASKVIYDDKEYYFDGPKDMLKFYYKNNKENFKDMYVTDYFTTKQINAKKAYFVVGSDVYGPMGKELVAFESDRAAYDFKNDHFGKKVMQLHEMTDEVLMYLQ